MDWPEVFFGKKTNISLADVEETARVGLKKLKGANIQVREAAKRLKEEIEKGKEKNELLKKMEERSRLCGH